MKQTHATARPYDSGSSTNGGPAAGASEPRALRAIEHEPIVSQLSARMQVGGEPDAPRAFRLRSAFRELSPTFMKICVGSRPRRMHSRAGA